MNAAVCDILPAWKNTDPPRMWSDPRRQAAVVPVGPMTAASRLSSEENEIEQAMHQAHFFAGPIVDCRLRRASRIDNPACSFDHGQKRAFGAELHECRPGKVESRPLNPGAGVPPSEPVEALLGGDHAAVVGNRRRTRDRSSTELGVCQNDLELAGPEIVESVHPSS